MKTIGIEYNSFDYDESISLKNVGLDFGHIKHESEWDNNPPFYYYCLWVWHHIFSISEFNARILNVIFSSLGVAIFHNFLNKKTDFKIAISTTLLLTFSNLVFFHSQEARCYALVFMLTICSTVVFFKLIEKPGILNALILGLLNFLVIYTHYIASLIILVQIITLTVHYKKHLKIFLISFSVSIVLVLLRFTAKQYLNILGFNKKNDFWVTKPEISDLNTAITDLFNNNFLLALFLAAIFLHFVTRKKTTEKDKLAFYEYGIFASTVPFLLTFTIAQYKPIFLSRYLIFSIPFIYMTVVTLANTVSSNNKIKFLLFTGALLLNISSYHFYLIKDFNYREVVEIVKKVNSNENNVVIINTRDNINLYCYYYRKDLFLSKNMPDSLKKHYIYAINEPYEIENETKLIEKNVILVQQYHNLNVNTNKILEHFSKNRKIRYNNKNCFGTEITYLTN